MKNEKLLEVRKLNKVFQSRFGQTLAVNNVSFNIERGEVMCLIGQSGTGKSTVANALMHLLRDVSGIVFLNDKVVPANLSRSEEKQYYRKVQMIYQDPHTSLNDKHNVFSIISEPVKAHRLHVRWAKEYMKSEKDVFQTFRLMFNRSFYQSRLKFLDFYMTNYQKSLEEIRKELDEANLFLASTPKLTSDQANNIFSRIVSAYYDTLIGFENSCLGQLNNEIESLISCYADARRKINDRELPWDEVELVNAKEELKNYVESYDDKLISYREKQLLKRTKKQVKILKNETNDVLRALIIDRRTKARYNRSQAKFQSTNEGYEKFNELATKYSRERSVFLNLYKKGLIISKSSLLEIDDNFDNVSYNKTSIEKLKKELRTFYNEATHKETKKIHSERDVLIANIASKRGAMHVPDKSVVHQMRERVVSAQDSFNRELEKALVEHEEFIKDNNQKITTIESRLKSSEWKMQVKSLDLLFKSTLKKALAFYESKPEIPNRKQRKLQIKEREFQLLDRKTQLLHKANQLKSHRYEQRKISREFISIKIILNIIKAPRMVRYFILKKLLLIRAVMNTLKSVGLKSEHAYRYPHEFSGGQKQRINIARALITEPELIIADEPVASLDVSIQAQIINIFVDLVKNKRISMVFIGHDLSVVRYLATTLVVMHEGRIIERGLSEKVFSHPTHPYTKTLFSVMPKISNANTPFKTPPTNHEYLKEYEISAPRQQLVEKDHYVLANDSQLASWRNEYKNSILDGEKPREIDTFEHIIKNQLESAIEPMDETILAIEKPSQTNETFLHKSLVIKNSVAKAKNKEQQTNTTKSFSKSDSPQYNSRHLALTGGEVLQKDIVIHFKDNKWFVRTDGSRAHKSFALQKEAIVYGKSMARKNQSTLLVEGKEGKVRVKFSYIEKPWKGKIEIK